MSRHAHHPHRSVVVSSSMTTAIDTAHNTRRRQDRPAEPHLPLQRDSAPDPAFPGARGFSLLELLVVVAIIALLVGLLLPALAKMRAAGRSAECTNNIRNLEIAHTLYVNENRGHFVDVGMGHGGSSANEERVWWINSLERYYGSKLSLRSPLDDSPHWSKENGGEGVPVPGAGGRFRVTSYGVNNYLSTVAPIRSWMRQSEIPMPSSTVHFLMMTPTGDYAGADHTHVESWHLAGKANAPRLASKQVYITGHSGGQKEEPTFEARAAWGFLDGSARVATFEEVYRAVDDNQFDPEFAR